MAHYMAINKSGKNLPIFSGWPSVDKGNQIGTIYNREVFIYGDTEDGVEVYFRNSSGRIVQGFYYATDANGNDLFSSNAEAMKALSSCIDYPFSTVTIGGTEYYTFKFRRNEEVYVPTEEDVLAARQQATEGMSQQQVERLTEVIKAANLWLEQRYMDENLFEKLSDPNSLYWNYFHQTGEIQIGWAVDGSIDIDAVCKREKLSLEEFYAKYGTPVVATNFYDADGFIDLLSEMKSSVQNEDLKSELQDLIDQTKQAKETHRMEIVNDIYKKLHDLDYFLLRYGPIDVAKYVKDDSTVSKYYGTLSFYQ